MIRPVRFAVLAFVVLGVLAIGAAVDWSSPSRDARFRRSSSRPLRNRMLSAQPATPAPTVKRPYEGRD